MTNIQAEEICQQNIPHATPELKVVHKKAVKMRNVWKSKCCKLERAAWENLKNDGEVGSRQDELLSTKGASSWLTALPLKERGFWMSKRDFRDTLALQYGWQLEGVAVSCVCGKAFLADHAMVCSFGGYPTIDIWHNELRDVIGKLLSEVCHNVAVEPVLQKLTGEVFTSKTANSSQEA